MNQISPPSPARHDGSRLSAEVCRVNEQLGRYVLRCLATDALAAKPLSPQAEHAIATRVAPAAVADAMQSRADRREQEEGPAPLGQLPPSDEQL